MNMTAVGPAGVCCAGSTDEDYTACMGMRRNSCRISTSCYLGTGQMSLVRKVQQSLRLHASWPQPADAWCAAASTACNTQQTDTKHPNKTQCTADSCLITNQLNP